MDYDAALASWYGRIDFEKRAALPGELKLDRMRRVLARLGDPQDHIRIVHVTGTKGKGSTSAMLAAVLRAAGYRVGLFTSPHLSDVRERIQVDGVPISRDELVARMTEIVAVSQDATFFEVGTALGFSHFDCRRVDVAIVEVGLGGRFDSTNVCSPIVSIITDISYDHMALLGDTLAKIAFEKAGIIKQGRPTVCTATAPEARAVIERIAAQRNSPLALVGRDFSYTSTAAPFVPDVLTMPGWPAMPLGLFGPHQAANAAGAVAAVEQLRREGFHIPNEAVCRGLANTVWPARMEPMRRDPWILLDCAHNTASARALVQTLERSFPVTGRKHLVFAVSTDKQVPEMLDELIPMFDTFTLTRYHNNPRCMAPEKVAALVRERRPDARVVIEPDPVAAVEQVMPAVNDLVVITGSVFLAGDLRSYWVRS